MPSFASRDSSMASGVARITGQDPRGKLCVVARQLMTSVGENHLSSRSLRLHCLLHRFAGVVSSPRRISHGRGRDRTRLSSDERIARKQQPHDGPNVHFPPANGARPVNANKTKPANVNRCVVRSIGSRSHSMRLQSPSRARRLTPNWSSGRWIRRTVGRDRCTSGRWLRGGFASLAGNRALPRPCPPAADPPRIRCCTSAFPHSTKLPPSACCSGASARCFRSTRASTRFSSTTTAAPTPPPKRWRRTTTSCRSRCSAVRSTSAMVVRSMPLCVAPSRRERNIRGATP